MGCPGNVWRLILRAYTVTSRRGSPMLSSNPPCRVRIVMLGLAAACLAIASPSSAQVRFEFTPFVGLYLPTANVIDNQFSPLCSCQLSEKQRTSFALGGRVAAWISDRLAFEGSL